MRIVVLGGGTAGHAFARRARFFDKQVELCILDKDGLDQYSPCSLPYFIEGRTNAVDVYADYDRDNITYYRGYTPMKREGNTLVCSHPHKEPIELSYDVLVIALGSIPKRLREEYYYLKSYADAQRIKQLSSDVAILGGGYIGVELSLSFDFSVSLYEKESHILGSYLDGDMATLVQEYLVSQGVRVVCNFTDAPIEKNVICCIGFEPNIAPLKQLDISPITTDFFASQENIYIIGDCSQNKNMLTGNKEYAFLGGLAKKQGELLAQNLFSSTPAPYQGFIVNSITKVGELLFGTVGLTARSAKQAGMRVFSARFSGLDKYARLGGRKLVVKLLFLSDGRIIGAQIVGYADVSGRLNLLSYCMRMKHTVHQLALLDTCYNPDSADITDPVVGAALLGVKKLSVINR